MLLGLPWGSPSQKMQTVLCRQKGDYGPARFMGRPRKLGIRTRHSSLVTQCCVLLRTFWQVSRLVGSSRTQRCCPFLERVGPRFMFLKASQVSSCSKRSLETITEPITVLTKNRQSMTACSFCCYYLEHCSTTYHIAIKRTNWTRSFAQNLSFSKFLKIRLSVTLSKYLASKLVGFLVGRRKKKALCDLEDRL